MNKQLLPILLLTAVVSGLYGMEIQLTKENVSEEKEIISFPVRDCSFTKWSKVTYYRLYSTNNDIVTAIEDVSNPERKYCSLFIIKNEAFENLPKENHETIKCFCKKNKSSSKSFI